MKPTILHRMMPVCAAEKVSVEKLASTQSQMNVGSQTRSMRPGDSVMRFGKADENKRACLFDPVVGSFACDDNVMHVALTQARAADADELCFLLQLRNGLCAAIAHT